MSGEMIEAYLDELMQASRALPVRDARHLMAETEAHLYDAVDMALAQGDDADLAERTALQAFGPVEELVTRERQRVRTPLRVLAAQFVHSTVVLGAVGAVAVGLTGVVSGAIYLAGGVSAIASRPTALDLTPANCARWLSHGGTNCRAAAMADWAAEIVWYRIALGVLGVLVLVGHQVLARRRGWRRGLAPVVSDSIATSLFVLAAVVSLGLGVDSIASQSGDGAGQWLSVAPVAALAAAFFARRVVHELRDPAVL